MAPDSRFPALRLAIIVLCALPVSVSQAMGRAGVPTPPAPKPEVIAMATPATNDESDSIEAMRAAVDELRRELAELKSRMGNDNDD